MEEFEILRKLKRVQAPPGFEQKVLAQLSLRKNSQREKRRIFRLSLAGAFASLLVGFILLNIFVLKQEAPPPGGSLQEKSFSLRSAGDRAEASLAVPIIETLDYSVEMRSQSLEPKAVYLLEQVSEKTFREINY